jgi:hypothetical protein
MKKISSLINKATAGFMILAFAVSSLGIGAVGVARAVATPNWDVTGSYVLNMEYLGTQYPHDLSLTQDGVGNLTGNGGSPAGGNIYTYDLTSGSVDGNSIDFMANYTATPDAVDPLTVMHVMGTIAEDGTISGTWSDNYAGGARSGAITTTSGVAVAIPVIGNISTHPATAITQNDATLNGKNETNNASGHSFWASLNTFETSSPSLPSGVFSTPDLGAINADTAFSASLSSVSGLSAITENTMYYFAAWSNVDGTWYPGAVMNFTTASAETPPAVNLGTAGNYVILAKTGISTTGSTQVVGDMGVSPYAATYITGFALNLPADSAFSTSALVDGNVYAPGYADPTPANLTTAVSDMETAYTTANGLAPGTTELGAGNIGGMTLAGGVYKWTTGVTIPTDVTLSGDADAVWVFQIAENLDISSATKVLLSGGAQASNIFWVVAGQTTIGSTATFNGNILDQTAIVLNTGAVLNGRALAQTAVTLDSNYVSDDFEAIPLAGVLSAEDFGVVNYDTGMGMMKGYTAGFGVADATFAGATSVVTKLYSGTTLLQTNTAILSKFNADITGVQFSTPFDVSGTFNYATDGYWTNVREAQFGQSVPANKVIALVTLANGKLVTAENAILVGDPTTIYPAEIGGDVEGVGVLAVSSVEIVDSTAVADGTFGNGWKYVFNITIPTNETHLAMKFADWAKTGGGGTIAAVNNMRISSPQANNGGATVLITAANTYSSPTLNMISDLDSELDGIQVKVTVETAIPIGSLNGAYTTSYGILTN